MTDEAWVYRASERGGLTRLEPRPFWASDDFSRSGSADDPAKVPPGAVVFRGVYATREAFVPFYFPPRNCPRLSIDPHADPVSGALLRHWVGPFRRLIVFAEPDRAALVGHAFSVYAFDAGRFRKLPTGEYLAETAVEPVSEARHKDAVAAIEAAGWAVSFVADVGTLRGLRDALHAVGVTRFSCEKL